MKEYLRKGFSIITILVYTFVLLFQNIPFLNIFTNVQAEDFANKDNLVLVLVDGDIYNNISSDINYYAGYIQRVNKNTKALVLPIDTKLITSYDIQKVISNLYFNGEKTKTSFLKGIVLIGNIPLPVINNKGYIFSSIYPYVDVKDPTFIYEDGGYFVPSGTKSDAELIHGLIKFSNINDYHKYFQKLQKYEQNPTNFVDKKFYYDNFVDQDNSFNSDMKKFYVNKLIFAENLVSKKITPLILDIFDKQNKQDLEKLNQGLDEINNIKFDTFKAPQNITKGGFVTNKLGFSDLNQTTDVEKVYKDKLNAYSKKIDGMINEIGKIKNNYWMVPTLSLEKSVKNFLKNQIDLYGSSYIGEMDKNLQATGRYTWKNTVSSLNTIDTKDEISVSYLNNINKFLEKELDKKIEEEKYNLYYPIMLSYSDFDINATSINGECTGDTYESFWFGKNGNDINSLSDIHIFRGTYNNIKTIDELKKQNSRGAKSIGSIMNNLFDIQTKSNRGYSSYKVTKQDSDNYKTQCSRKNGVCIDLGKNGGEQVRPRAKRIFGGYSPLNVKIDNMNDYSNIKFNYEDYKYAWHPSITPLKNGSLFDLGGTIENKVKELNNYTNTINGIEKYVAVWRISHPGYFGSSCTYDDGNNKIQGNYYNYFQLYKQIEDSCDNTIGFGSIGLNKDKKYVKFISNDKFLIEDDDECSILKDKEYKFKFINTIVKHTSPTQEEFSGFNIGTPLRPVDSKNYITFLGVAGKQVTLDYPDIFQTNVYKLVNGTYKLKKPNEIKTTIKEYLKKIIKDYNTILEKQLNEKETYYNNNKKAFDEFDNLYYKPHNYNLLDENYFIDKIGEEKLSQIAEMLYYINLGWKEKPEFSNLQDEIDYLYNAFDVNEKISYIIGNYINTEDDYNVDGINISKSNKNFFSKPEKGYEAGMIVSKKTDNIDGKKDLGNDEQYYGGNTLGGDTLPIPVEEKQEEECGKPLGEGVILWEWPAAFVCRLKETLKKPFKIGTSTACSLGNSDNNGGTELSPEDENTKIEKECRAKGQEYLEEYELLKDYINNGISIKTNQQSYLNEEMTGHILIRDYSSNLGSFINNGLKNPISYVYIWSPKQEGNCMYLNIDGEYKNTCDGIKLPLDKWKLDFAFFNLKTGEGRYYAYKAGSKSMGFKFCSTNNVCYVKGLYFDKLAGKLKDVEIKPFSSVMLYGGENPVVIQGYDAKKNEARYRNLVNYTNYNYKLYLDPPIGIFKYYLQKGGSSKIDYNFDSTQDLLLIKSNTEPLPGVNNFNLVLELDPIWQKTLQNEDIFKKTSINIGITSRKKLLNSEVKLIPSNYQPPKNPYSLVKKINGIKIYDKTKLLKLHIKPVVADKTLKTPVYIETTNQLIAGSFRKISATNASGDKIIYEKFEKTNDFLISKDEGLDIYFLPTYKNGDYTITIKIPGFNDYTIKGKIKEFPIKDLYIKLDKFKAKKGEKVKGTVYAVDEFGNLNKVNANNVNIITSSGVKVDRNGANIEVSAIKNGFVKFKYSNKEKTINFAVENTFLPLNKKISVMYLTLLGYDWGKYASKIMSNSSKNLAITTTLHDKNNILNYDYVITDSLKNQGDFLSELYFKPNLFKINLGGIELVYTGNIFNQDIKEITDINSIFNNGIYYIKEKEDDYIKENKLENNKLIINGITVIDFTKQLKKQAIKIQYNKNLSKKYGVYNIFYNTKKIGEIIFKGKVLNINKLNPSKPIYKNIIYANGSTNGGKAIGLTISGIGGYEVISKATIMDIDKDKGLGFRSNFRNITDFAAGNNVGQSTKPFENELLINYGDPFVKRISKEEGVSNTGVSKTYGKRIFSSINGRIKKVVTLDFNNDGLKDIAILYQDKKIRLLKNYKGYENFEDLGNLLFLGKGAKDIFAGDVNGDGYEDLFVTFQDNTIRVYKNNNGEFEVNGTPICLPLPMTDGEHLDYEQIFFRDMNNDKKTDIVVNDRASNVDVYFGPSYLSKDKKYCDVNYKSRIIKKHVKSYGMIIEENKKFADAGYIYRDGMKNNSTLLQNEVKQAFEKKDMKSLPTNSTTTPETYLKDVGSANKDKFAFQPIPKAIGPSFVTGYDYIEFKKVTFLAEDDDIKVYKTMRGLSGTNLLPGDKVEVTLHIENPKGKKLTYLEEFKGPFAVISDNNEPVIKLNGVSKNNITYPKGAYRQFLFRIDNTNSQNIEITYYAYFLGESTVKIKVDDWDKNNYGDIKVFLKNGCIKGYDYFQGQSGTPMNFNYSFVDLAAKLREFNNKAPGNKKIDDIKQKLDDGKYEELLDEYASSEEDDPYVQFNYTDEMTATLEINGPDLSALKARVDGVLKGLCNGFSFGKSSCTGSPIPCNYAFLAPGIINACGCPVGFDPGTPVFWYPGTIWTPDGPKKIPNGLLFPFPGDPSGPTPGVYPSFIRLYVSPTLTMGLGVAVCFGPYLNGIVNPVPPLGAIAGNCVVAAGELKASCKKKDADDELESWMEDLDNGICSQLPIETGTFPTSSISAEGIGSFEQSPYHSDISASFSIAGKSIISFNATATKINSLADAKALMQGGEPLNLHIKLGTFKGIISCIIKKWLNHQIQFIISQLTHMTIYVTYPDMSGLMKGFSDKDWGEFGNLGTNLGGVLDKFGFGKSSGTSVSNDKLSKFSNIVSKYLPSKDGLKELSNSLSNPFEAIGAYFEDIPLVNVYMRTVVIQVPWIGKDELDRQIAYMETWLEDNKKVIESRKKLGKKIKNGDIIKAQKFINSVKKNLQILQEYRNFPQKLYKYLHLLDYYLDQVMCIIKTYIKLIVGWLNTQSKIFEKWVDAIITLINVFRTWQLLIDISVDWKSSCGKCRQDTGDLYDCVLLGLCPSLPVLPIPPFKIPDIFIDFTHIDLGLDIVLPKIKIRPVPIGIFTLPNLPYLGLNIELPALPILPAPPELPDLPPLPPVPTIELPNLPPPPLIPNLIPSLQVALNIFKIVGYFRCIIKNGIGLVAEWNVKTRIEQLTARHNQLFPFDFLNIDFPELPFKGFDVRVDGYLRFRVEMKQLYEAVKSLAESINEKTRPMIGEMLEFNLKVNEKADNLLPSDININIKPGDNASKNLNNKFRKTENNWQNKIDKATDKLLNYNPFIINDKPIKVSLAKKLLENEIKTFINQKGAPYLVKLPSYHFDTANKLLSDVKNNNKVNSNISGIKDIERQINNLVNKQRQQIYKTKIILEKLEHGEKIDMNDDIFVKKSNSNLVSLNEDKDEIINFKTSLFKTNKKTLSIIKNSKSPEQYYIGMYTKLLNKIDEKIEKYKNKDPRYKIIEDQVYQTKSLINNTKPKISYAQGGNTEQPIIADPSQTIRGLYMEGENETYYNVMADKDKAKKLRSSKNYFFDDINKDNKKDLIWYDKNSVYIKYSGDEPEDNGVIITKKYIYNSIISNFNSIVDNNGYLELNGSSFKLIDKIRPINNLTTYNTNPNSIKIKWRKTDNVNAYVIIYSSRIDILNDVEKKFNYASNFPYYGNNYKIYATVLYDKKLGAINEIIANNMIINGHKVEALDYMPYNFEDKIKFNAVLSKLFYESKWKYFRVYNANLNLEIKKLDILSSYSNQDVGGKQIIGDNLSPIVTPELIRVKTNKVIGTGKKLLALLNTDYILKAKWKDEVGIKNKYITDIGFNVLANGDTLHIPPKNNKHTEFYYLIGEDYNGNITRQRIAIIFTVPNIKIDKVNSELGQVVSNIGHDMDKSAVKYGIITPYGFKIIDSISGKDIFTGGVGQTYFTGSIFDNQNKVKLYNKEQKQIGTLNLLNGIVKIDNPYYILGTVEKGTLYYNIYNEKGEKIFSMYIPSEKLIKEPELLNSEIYDIKKISNNNLGLFARSTCIYDKINNICAMYISNKGLVYVEKNYRDKFIFDYIPNELGNIMVNVYDVSIPDKSLLTNDKKIFNYIFKAKKIINR